MIGFIKAISPCVKSASAKLFLDLHTVLAPSGEERTLSASAQVERAALCFRRLSCAQPGVRWVMVRGAGGVRSLRAARERLHSRSAILRAVYPVP